MNTNRILSTLDSLYDRVRGDREVFMNEDEFLVKVDELVETDYIQTNILDDYTIYSARAGLKWNDFVHIDDGVKKSILLLLVENPTTFFVLLNTQKGKMRIASLEMKMWSEDKTHKVVSFIIVDNDKTLGDQSVDGLQKTFGEEPVKIFSLNSNSKTTFDEIKTYIDAYANDNSEEPEYCMPLIALLCNTKQCEKMIRLLQHIHRKVERYNSKLRYGIIWDEADKTYPQLRNKQFSIDGGSASFYTYIVEKNAALYRLGFVTATDGDLLDEDYPECANAYLYPVVISPEDEIHYRALHHPESQIHRVAFKSRHTNNAYAIEIIEKNPAHFKNPIILPSGEVYYKKTIINSNATQKDMDKLARWSTTQNMYAIVFNGYNGLSIKVYKQEDSRPSKFNMKGKIFNEMLFYVYKKLELHDKPLVIIGRRKVDRGLGFHYCPRVCDEVTIDGLLGTLVTRNMESLIWTDIILGRIEDKNTAVQKSGRAAGIIGNSPQYPGVIHYWTDEHTENIIRRHNQIVDQSNKFEGCSILQAVKHAESVTPVIRVNHRTDLDTFLVYTSEEIVKNVCAKLGYQYTAPRNLTEEGFFKTSLNKTAAVVSLIDTIKHIPGSYGTADKDKEGEDITKRKQKYVKITEGDKKGEFGLMTTRVDANNYNIKIKGQMYVFERKSFDMVTYRTFYPCYKNTTDKESLHYVVVIRPETDPVKLTEVRTAYPSLVIPQEGDF